MPDSIMTNATVGKVDQAPQGPVLHVTFKGTDAAALAIPPGLGLSLRSVWAVDRPNLFRRDALPGDLAVFFALAGPARRRNENHALALKAHPAHLITPDTARI
jgi:hypothetical protein